MLLMLPVKYTHVLSEEDYQHMRKNRYLFKRGLIRHYDRNLVKFHNASFIAWYANASTKHKKQYNKHPPYVWAAMVDISKMFCGIVKLTNFNIESVEKILIAPTGVKYYYRAIPKVIHLPHIA